MSTPVHAEIINVDSGQKVVECMFNPREYTFTKSNTWEKQKNAGGNVPQVTFGGGEPATLSIELLFDTYLDGGEKAADVRKTYTEKIWELMKADPKYSQKKPKKARPPFVRFHWGEAWSFVGVITQIQEKFTLFTSNGTPVRATLTVSFQQLKDEGTLPPQNPTSGGVSGERVWTVADGDTLALIASREYGDPAQWRRIAEANRLETVRELRAGTVLVIPNA
jgi:nucleoid-associated protein YgaU